MSAIQIVCAVAVPLLWGYQFVAIKMGVTEFPPLFFLALRFLAIALLLVPFVKRPARQQFGPIAAISVFLGGLNFGLFYVGLGLGSGSMSAVAYQLATPFTVLLAWPLLAEKPKFHIWFGRKPRRTVNVGLSKLSAVASQYSGREESEAFFTSAA